MRILFIQKIKGLAGSENYFLNIMPRLKAKGVDCEFLAIFPADFKSKVAVVTDQMEADGIKVHYLETEKDLGWGLLKSINQFIVKGNYDLVNTHLIHADFWGAMIKRLMNRKMVLVSGKHGYDEIFMNKHGFDPNARMYNLYYWLAYTAERFIDRSYSISKGLMKLMVSNGISKSDKIDLIYYGFDLNYQGSKNIPEKRYSDLQLIIVGRLIPLKGHAYVFETISDLAKRFPNLKLVIVGSGDYKETLIQKTKDLGIEEHVVFTGFRRDVMELVANSDIMIVPSTSEGFGLVFMEAFETKTPVVAFDVPAGNEIIIDGHSGHLVKPYDTTELKEKIADLIEHPEKRDLFAKQAYERLKEFFTLDRMTDETIAFYQKVLNAKRS